MRTIEWYVGKNGDYSGGTFEVPDEMPDYQITEIAEQYIYNCIELGWEELEDGETSEYNEP